MSGNANAARGRNASTAHSETRLKTAYRRSAVRRRGEHAEVMTVAGGSVAAPRRDRQTPFAWDVWSRVPPRFSWLYALAAVAAALLAFAFVNPVAQYAPALRPAIETMITSLALASAWLLQAQFVRTRRARDLMLFCAMLMMATVELVAYCVPAAFNLSAGTYFGVVALWGPLLAASAFVGAGLAPPDRLIRGGRRPVAVAAAVSLGLIGIAQLPGVLLGEVIVAAPDHPLPGVHEALRHPLALVLAIASGALFAYAAYALCRTARHEATSTGTRQSGITLLAGAAILGAAARLYYLPLPWVSPNWVSPREGMRLLAFALVFAAAIRQELAIRAGIARAAAVAERRRVAQDLHDGLAQDLALIAAHGPLMADHLGDEHPVTVAARRALAVSRGTISDLSDPAAATTREGLEAIATDLRARFEIGIAVDGGLDAEPAPYVREDLWRIAREAIANAARHGDAREVIVSLRRTPEGITLRVADDGRGIGFRENAGDGFGLGHMRERAAAMGGRLSIRQSGRRGTELEVTIP